MDEKKSTPTNTGKPAEWVIARYTGAQAKHVIGVAGHGIGYKIMDQPASGEAWVEVAFLRPIDGPTPDHLTRVESPDLLKQLEAWHHAR